MLILNLGGVPAIAAMTNGLILKIHQQILLLVQEISFVAEAKRIYLEKLGIDLFAGPTEIGIIADDIADPEIVAVDISWPS
jgi:sulfopropanediol 3-dehydrogenase